MKSQSSFGSSAGAIAPRTPILTFFVKKIRHVLPPTFFFAVGFNVIVLTTQLIFADYLIHFTNFIVLTFSALVVCKAVLLANGVPFIRRFDTAPIVQPILFKTIIYCVVVLLVRILEQVVKYFLAGGALSGISDYIPNHFSLKRVIA